jgi:phosphopantothenoylcysteine synthetase/decarboxylase
MLAIITTGPSSTPIDQVRRITNSATGEIGTLLAAALHEAGFEPHLFRGRGATFPAPTKNAFLHEFSTNAELAVGLHELAESRGREVCAVFHAAALADYDVAAMRGPDGEPLDPHKIPGSLACVHLVLVPAPKILPRLRTWFPRAWIVGWKYELEGTREDALNAAREQIANAHTDATILNGAAYGPGFALLPSHQSPLHLDTKREVACLLASQAATSAKADR